MTCHGSLSVMPQDVLACRQCGSAYPVVNGIPVFMPRGADVLGAYVQEMREARTQLKQIERNLAPVINDDAHELSERAKSLMEGLSKNIELMERHCRPIVEHLQDNNLKDDLLAWAAVQTGFPYREMLPYFYQDWYGTSDFEAVKALFEEALSEHCADREVVGVLGAGACGLLYALSGHFRRSIGVDLSLPVLLTAKHFINGESISIYLERARWKRVDLSPPKPPDNAIQYVAANVMTLPFRDAYLSAVITQYLMDIVGNPIWLMAEIHRVLKPNGIWINFSNPFQVRDDPIELGHRLLPEVSALLRRVGFNVLNLDRTRFRLLNMEMISPGGDRSDQEVHLFAAERTADKTGSLRLAISGRFTKNDTHLWGRIPKVVKGREVALISKKQFMQNGVKWQSGVGVVMNHSIPIVAEHACLLDTIFTLIDGKRTLSDIWDILCANNVGALTEEDFLELIRCLNVDHYLIELC